jgi:putative peptidoglycan lipid II flippase
MRGYIVRLLLGFGDQVTADVLGWLSGVIIAQSVFYVVARIFYALEDTRTPLFTSLMTLGLNVFFSFWMAKEFGVPGLAMAISLVTSIELLFLLFMLKRKIGDYGIRAIAWLAAKVFFAAAVMSGVMYGLITVFFPLYRDERGWRVLGPKFLIVCIVGGLVYFVICWILRVEETRAVWRLTESKYLNKLRKKVWGRG